MGRRSANSPKSSAPAAKPVPREPDAKPAPAWLRPVILTLAAVLLLGWFATELRDSDAWWHLKTGEYLWQRHHLPAPDPFAYTTYLSGPAYPGEEKVRDFNLTHEWLAPILLYLPYAIGGIPGLLF